MHPRDQPILFLLQLHLSVLNFLVLLPQVNNSIHGDETASDVMKTGIRLSPLRRQPGSALVNPVESQSINVLSKSG